MAPRPATQLALTISTALASACGGGEAPAPRVRATTQPASATPPRPVAVDDDAPVSARTVALTLHLAAARRGLIGLHRLGDGEIAFSGGLLLARVRSGTSEVAQDPAWLAGLPSADPAQGWSIHALGGHGDHLWLTLARPDEYSALRWAPGGWVPVEVEPGHYYADYTTWPDGHAIALRLGSGPPRLDLLDETGPRPATSRFEAPGLVAAARPTALAALASGELFAGLAAEPGRFAAVLRWGPDLAQGHLAPLPTFESRAPRQIAVLVEGPAHDVLIGDTVEMGERQIPYVARFDGTSWRLLDPPPIEGTVVSLVEGAGPVIWAIIRSAGEAGPSNSLWRLQASSDWDAWERVELAPVRLGPAADPWWWDSTALRWRHDVGASEEPLNPAPLRVGLDAAGDLWVLARLLHEDGSSAERHAVLRSREVTGPRSLLSDPQVLAAQQDLAPPRPHRTGDLACPQVFVQLYTPTVDTPEVGTPELLAALAEGPLATALLGEVTSRGARRVGLLLSASEADAARPAIAALASRLKLKTSATCGHPPLVRGFRARDE